MKPLIEEMFVYQNNREVDDRRNDLNPLDDQDLISWTQVSFPLEFQLKPSGQEFLIVEYDFN